MIRQWPPACPRLPASSPDKGQKVTLWAGGLQWLLPLISHSPCNNLFIYRHRLDREAGLAFSWPAAMFTKV